MQKKDWVFLWENMHQSMFRNWENSSSTLHPPPKHLFSIEIEISATVLVQFVNIYILLSWLLSLLKKRLQESLVYKSINKSRNNNSLHIICLDSRDIWNSIYCTLYSTYYASANLPSSCITKSRIYESGLLLSLNG